LDTGKLFSAPFPVSEYSCYILAVLGDFILCAKNKTRVQNVFLRKKMKEVNLCGKDIIKENKDLK
jgi:hypothetical protein